MRLSGLYPDERPNAPAGVTPCADRSGLDIGTKGSGAERRHILTETKEDGMATVMDRDTLPAERPELLRLTVEDDADGWRLAATNAKDGLRLRHAFRDYLEAYGDPACDFAAAETVYGELVGNCA